MSSFIPNTLDLDFLSNYILDETALLSFDLETLPPIEDEDQVNFNDTYITAPDEQDLLSECFSPQLLTGQTLAGNTASGAQEEMILKFFLNERGELVSDHTYTVQQMPRSEEMPPEEQFVAPPTDAGRAPTPITGQWNGLGETKVDIPSGPPPMLRLMVVGTPEHYRYSEHNSLHHIKSQGKVSVTALLKG